MLYQKRHNRYDRLKRAVNRKHNALQGSCGRWDHAFVQRITDKKLTNKGLEQAPKNQARTFGQGG